MAPRNSTYLVPESIFNAAPNSRAGSVVLPLARVPPLLYTLAQLCARGADTDFPSCAPCLWRLLFLEVSPLRRQWSVGRGRH